MILQEMGPEPPNVQVIVQQEIGGSRVHLSLQDAEGVFLEAEPGAEPDRDATEGPPAAEEFERAPPDDRADEVETLKQALDEVTNENAALATEVSVLRERVEREKISQRTLEAEL